MRYSYFILLFLLSSSILLKTTSASGQQLKLEQVKPSKEGYFLDFPGGHSVAHYFVAGPSETAAVFRHVVLDSALRLRHERSLRVGGSGTQALGCGSNRRAALYRFESHRSTDDPAQDRCSKKISGCECRFGVNEPLSFGGFLSDTLS